MVPYLRVQEGAGGLERDLQSDELKRQVIGAVHEALLQLVDVPPRGLLLRGAPRGVLLAQDERLVGGDDAADPLEVADDGALAAEDGGRVDEERVEEAEVARGQVQSPHQRRLGDLDRLRGARRRVHAHPRAPPTAAPLQAVDVDGHAARPAPRADRRRGAAVVGPVRRGAG